MRYWESVCVYVRRFVCGILSYNKESSVYCYSTSSYFSCGNRLSAVASTVNTTHTYAKLTHAHTSRVWDQHIESMWVTTILFLIGSTNFFFVVDTFRCICSPFRKLTQQRFHSTFKCVTHTHVTGMRLYWLVVFVFFLSLLISRSQWLGDGTMV